jgi:hypothetical protein
MVATLKKGGCPPTLYTRAHIHPINTYMYYVYVCVCAHVYPNKHVCVHMYEEATILQYSMGHVTNLSSKVQYFIMLFMVGSGQE